MDFIRRVLYIAINDARCGCHLLHVVYGSARDSNLLCHYNDNLYMGCEGAWFALGYPYDFVTYRVDSICNVAGPDVTGQQEEQTPSDTDRRNIGGTFTATV